MLEAINQIDHTLFLFLNGHHNPTMDAVMFKATQPIVWTPLFLLLLYFVIRRYHWKTLLILAVVALMIVVSDQLANLFKDTFQRLRPSQEPGLPVHLVNAYKGGLYGFFSSHASNSFAISFFLIGLFRSRTKWIYLLPLWAVFFSYTRIYLGVHFPGDILMGWTIGMALGIGFSWGAKRLFHL